MLLKRFSGAVRSVTNEVRPLLLPHVMRLAAMLAPGLHTISWADPAWERFYMDTLDAVKRFEQLVHRY